MALPTLDPSAEVTEPVETLATEPTEAVQPSDTPAPSRTPVPTRTPTLLPTETPRPTQPPPPTSEPTLAAASSATAAVLEAPRFSTFTPAPPGSSPPPGTPQQIADVVITEAQFQEEVNLKITTYESMQMARVDFVPGGINVDLTALGGEAFISGRVFVSITVSGGIAAISPTEITVNAPEPPEAYVVTVSGDFTLLMIDVMDTILRARLGPDQDLENIVMTDREMLITLLVPQ
jgi:hypothetical protein